MRFYITSNMGIPVIQRWQNNHWIFDRWPTDEEIKQEKVLKYNYDINKEFNNRNRLERKCTESIIINDELETYKFHPIPNTLLRFPLITDSQVYTVDTHNHSHKYLLTQMEIDSVATQGEKGTDHTWVGSDYEGGYCPRRCRCPCCGRSY